jgi:hypothetical protein
MGFWCLPAVPNTPATHKTSFGSAIKRPARSIWYGYAARSCRTWRFWARAEWIGFPAGPQLLEALNAGAIDFGHTGDAPPILAQSAGVPFVYVAHEPSRSHS